MQQPSQRDLSGQVLGSQFAIVRKLATIPLVRSDHFSAGVTTLALAPQVG